MNCHIAGWLPAVGNRQRVLSFGADGPAPRLRWCSSAVPARTWSRRVRSSRPRRPAEPARRRRSLAGQPVDLRRPW